MGFKVIALLLALVGVALAVPVEYSEVSKGYKQLEYHHDTPAEYEFSYSVHDEHTGDIKSQQESRKGNVVHGRYELIDSDGHRRIVEYSVDEHSGFNAVVHREPTDIRIPQPVHEVQKVLSPLPRLIAAPSIKIATPIVEQHGHNYQK